MGFVVLHMEKAHGSDSGTTAHIERFIIPKNADPTRTHLNRRLIEYPDGVKDRSAAIQQRLEEAGLTRKIGSNQVRAIRINVSGTPLFFYPLHVLVRSRHVDADCPYLVASDFACQPRFF